MDDAALGDKRALKQQSKGKPSVYLTSSLCKFYLTGHCHRGPSCHFSHQTKEFPCKYLHATGKCDKGENCIFRHTLMNEAELQKFMKENEDFLWSTLRDTGKTNLSDIFTNYLEQKKKFEAEKAVPKDVMIPPSLIQSVEPVKTDPANLIQKNNEIVGNL